MLDLPIFLTFWQQTDGGALVIGSTAMVVLGGVIGTLAGVVAFMFRYAMTLRDKADVDKDAQIATWRGMYVSEHDALRQLAETTGRVANAATRSLELARNSSP